MNNFQKRIHNSSCQDIRTDRCHRRQQIQLPCYYLFGRKSCRFYGDLPTRLPSLIPCNPILLNKWLMTCVHPMITNNKFTYVICKHIRINTIFVLVIIQSNVVSIPDTKHAHFVNFVFPIKKLPQKSCVISSVYMVKVYVNMCT